MFVGNIWSKLREEAKYQSEKVQDFIAQIEYLQSILFSLDANNALRKNQLGRYRYDSLNPLIKIWITNIGDHIP